MLGVEPRSTRTQGSRSTAELHHQGHKPSHHSPYKPRETEATWLQLQGAATLLRHAGICISSLPAINNFKSSAAMGSLLSKKKIYSTKTKRNETKKIKPKEHVHIEKCPEQYTHCDCSPSACMLGGHYVSQLISPQLAHSQSSAESRSGRTCLLHCTDEGTKAREGQVVPGVSTLLSIRE